MTSYIVTVQLGTDYYETLRICCDDITDAIYKVCAQEGCRSDCVVSVVRQVV